MIIKEIKIKNFRSYYGENMFSFSNGLTLIIASNGDGKTTFFESLQWLFNTTIEKGNEDYVSAKRLKELQLGEIDEVSVTITFDHDGEKIIEKAFTFERLMDNTIKIGNLRYKGFETNGIEREQVNGKVLMDRCYDAFIQRFTMFKGEAELNVFRNASALKNLVDQFSDIKKFDKLVELTTFFEKNANTAYVKAMNKDSKVSRQATLLDSKITKLSDYISSIKKQIEEKQASLDSYNSTLKSLESTKESSETYKDLKARLDQKTAEANSQRAIISAVDYNHALLDKLWVLAPFPSILKEFQQKCSALSREKRLQERDFDRQQAAAKAKLDTIKEVQGVLINGATELPWYLPDQETMEEMINEHICKVCGRPAPEGSDAYNFMIQKLEDYKSHVEAKVKREQDKKELEEKVLFVNRNIEDLHNLSIRLGGDKESQICSIASDIKDRLDLVQKVTQKLHSVEAKIEEIKAEKTRLLIQAGNVSEDLLDSQYNDIRGIYNQREKATVRLAELNFELSSEEDRMSELKKQMDSLNPSGLEVKTLRDVHNVLDAIAKAFVRAQKNNLKNFLLDLEYTANKFMERLSGHDLSGEIRLVQTTNDSTEIRLYSSDGREIKKPSGSQNTVMFISVLFAISDFAENKRDEAYPLIFDAPTSSFDENKKAEFYNVINELDKQCIVISKDFLDKEGNLIMNDIKELTCSVYILGKAKGFVKGDMSTVATIHKKIK